VTLLSLLAVPRTGSQKHANDAVTNCPLFPYVVVHYKLSLLPLRSCALQIALSSPTQLCITNCHVFPYVVVHYKLPSLPLRSCALQIAMSSLTQLCITNCPLFPYIVVHFTERPRLPSGPFAVLHQALLFVFFY
jgi:hypothetical protein